MATGLGGARCSEIDVDGPAVSLLATVTGLTERQVRKRLNDARGNTLIRNVFDEQWPWDAESLKPLTVATAKRAELQSEIAGPTGMTPRRVKTRLDQTAGNTLLGNAFPELESDDDDFVDDDDDDDVDDAGARAPDRAQYEDGRRKFEPVDLLGAIRTISVRSTPAFIWWIAAVLQVSKPTAKKRIASAHGRTLLKTAFDDRWPPDDLGEISRDAIGAITSASARRSPSLVRLIADEARLSPGIVFRRLGDAQGNTHVETIVPELAAQGDPAPPKPKPKQPKPGPRAVTVGGRYELGERIGSGGFGEVYEATLIEPPHYRVVVKLQLPGSPHRLREEIGVAYRLTHQNICPYKECGTDEKLGTYLVLAHGGRSLESILEEDDGGLEVEPALGILAQAAAGLDFAHEEGVIHQDVKPGNILVDGDPAGRCKVRVTDFGISLQGVAAKNTVGKHTVIATRSFGYSPGYAAPEQRNGEKARKASDQFSLALVFCSMLEGEILDDDYERRSFSRLTSRANAALKRALSPLPEDRFASCSEFAAALAAGQNR